ncbi:MAG TPA: CoA-binding protein [Chloroflexia bacterium]|nr:CoA-binding protein [Chloroflexia bacterium]
MTTREQIDDFLAQKTLALVGISHVETDFSRGLYRDMVKRGYEMIPVNPTATEIEGKTCYPDVGSIPFKVDGVIVMTTPAVAEQVVKDCDKAGIKRVWLHRGVGQGAVSQAAIDYCEAHGIEVISGYCPYMFLPENGFFHSAHRFFRTMGKNKLVTTS